MLICEECNSKIPFNEWYFTLREMDEYNETKHIFCQDCIKAPDEFYVKRL